MVGLIIGWWIVSEVEYNFESEHEGLKSVYFELGGVVWGGF